MGFGGGSARMMYKIFRCTSSYSMWRILRGKWKSMHMCGHQYTHTGARGFDGGKRAKWCTL